MVGTALDSMFASANEVGNLMTDGLQGAEEVLLSKISVDPNQPRKVFKDEDLQELANSIKLHGVLQPISIRADDSKEDHYIINFGERRFRACKLLGMEKIPCTLNNDADPLAQVVENLIRSDLTMLEIGDFILEQIKLGKSQADICELLSKDSAWVSKHKSIAEKSPQVVRDAIKQETITSVEVAHKLGNMINKGDKDAENFIKNTAQDAKITTTMLRDFVRNQKVLSTEKVTKPTQAEETPHSINQTEKIETNKNLDDNFSDNLNTEEEPTSKDSPKIKEHQTSSASDKPKKPSNKKPKESNHFAILSELKESELLTISCIINSDETIGAIRSLSESEHDNLQAIIASIINFDGSDAEVMEQLKKALDLD